MGHAGIRPNLSFADVVKKENPKPSVRASNGTKAPATKYRSANVTVVRPCSMGEWPSERREIISESCILIEKGKNNQQIYEERERRLSAALKDVYSLLKDQPMNEIKSKDLKEQIKNHHHHLTNYLKDDQSNNISGTSEVLSHSLMEKPKPRPKAMESLNRPQFWTSEKGLSFLRDASKKAGDPKYSSLRHELQKILVETVTGTKWKEKKVKSWDEMINDGNVISYIMKQKEECGYDFCSVRDLVRLIRNMMVHYGELPKDVQRSVGTLHKGFHSFFASRFPNLLNEVYKAVCECCKEDEYFSRYFQGCSCS